MRSAVRLLEVVLGMRRGRPGISQQTLAHLQTLLCDRIRQDLESKRSDLDSPAAQPKQPLPPLQLTLRGGVLREKPLRQLLRLHASGLRVRLRDTAIDKTGRGETAGQFAARLRREHPAGHYDEVTRGELRGLLQFAFEPGDRPFDQLP